VIFLGITKSRSVAEYGYTAQGQLLDDAAAAFENIFS
jgi:hypothetical protein